MREEQHFGEEVDWTEFFHTAYPRAGALAAASGDSLLGDLDRGLGERETAGEEVSDVEFEERVKQVLHHLGLLLDEDDETELGERKKTA